jgi:hypothetical protein
MSSSDSSKPIDSQTDASEFKVDSEGKDAPRTTYAGVLATIDKFKVGGPVQGSIAKGSNFWIVESTEPITIRGEVHNPVRGFIEYYHGKEYLEWYMKQKNFTIQSYVVTSTEENPDKKGLAVDKIITEFVTLTQRKKNQHWFGFWWHMVESGATEPCTYLMQGAEMLVADVRVVRHYYAVNRPENPILKHGVPCDDTEKKDEDLVWGPTHLK